MKGKRNVDLGPGWLGMKLFLLALGVLFAASVVGYVAVSLKATEWPPPGAPSLPPGLWLSTLLILLSSGTLVIALQKGRQLNRKEALGWLVATTVLALGFLANQVLSWVSLAALRLTGAAKLYLFTFFVLTALHAAHLLGGVVALIWASWKTANANRMASLPSLLGYVAMYWHFLTAVWLVLFGVLKFF